MPEPVDTAGAGGRLAEGGREVPVALGPEEGGDLLQLFDVLWHRRWIVFFSVALSLAGGFLYLSRAIPIYRSTSRLYVEKEGPAIISNREGLILGQSQNYLYTQAELVKSVPILGSALKSLSPRSMKSFRNVDNHLAFLKESLEAEVGRKDEILSISFECPYPTEAAQIVNAVVDSYITYLTKQKQSTAAQILKILKEDKVKREKELRDSLQAIVEYKRKNGVVVLQGERGNILIQQLSQLTDALVQAQLEAIDAQTSYQNIKAVAGEPEKVRRLVGTYSLGVSYTPSSARSKYLQMRQQFFSLRQGLTERLRAAEEELLTLRSEFTDNTPAVKAAKRRVEALKQELSDLDQELQAVKKELESEEKEFVDACLEVARQRAEIAQRRVEELSQAVEAQRKLAEEAAVKEAEYAVLSSELDRAKRTCELLDDRIKELNLTEDTGALNVTVVEVARPEEKPVKPRKALTMALALMVGLMLGVGLAFLREWIDQRIRTPEDAAASAGAPLLGVIPHLKDPEADGDTGRWVALRPESSYAEAFRTVRTAVYFGIPKERSQLLLITSPGPAEGKSIVCGNLAIAMAKAGQRVVIVDADFRRPSQHVVFDVQNEIGLSNVLVGHNSLRESLRTTSVKNLLVLPCGPRPVNPAELLNSKAFSSVLQKLAACCDRVLVDSPPLLGFADSRIIAAVAHATVLVVRCEETTRKAIEAAREALTSVGGLLLGVVVNDMTERSRRYGSYYGYYYGYYRKYYQKYYQSGGSDGQGKSSRRRASTRRFEVPQTPSEE